MKNKSNPSAESEKTFEYIFENTIDGIVLVDAETKRFDMGNRSLCRMLGYTKEELLALTVYDIHPGDALPRIEESFNLLVKKEIERARDIPVLRKDGSLFYADIAASPIQYDDRPHLLATFRDITEHKKAGQSLKDSEEKYRTLVDNMQDAVFRSDLKGNIVFTTPSAARLLGCPSAEWMIGTKIIDYHCYPEVAKKQMDILIERGKLTQLENVLKRMDNGESVTVLANIQFWKDGHGNIIGLEGVYHDITERKRIEENLKKSEARVKKAQTIGQIGYTEQVISSQEVWASAEGMRILGFPPIEGFVPLEKVKACFTEFEPLRKAYHELLESGRKFDNEFVINPADGSPQRYIHMIVDLERDAGGKPHKLLGIFQDITTSKLAEKELVSSEETFRKAFNSNPMIIGISTLSDGRYIDINDNFTKVLEWERDEVIGHTSSELDIFQDYVQRDETAAYLKEHGHLRNHEIALKTRSGKTRIAEISAELVYIKGERCVLAQINDITERKQAVMELQLNAHRTEALLQLNQMAGASLQEITDYALEEAVRLTGSTIGYLAFLNEDESILTMHSWSRTAMAECAISQKPIHYPITETGLWGEAVRQRKQVITNDYSAYNPLKKGCPDGHVRIFRHMNIPVFEGSHIVLVAGVGNKKEEYDVKDCQQLTLLMEGMWRLVERKRAEEERRRLEHQLSLSQRMDAIGQLAGGVAHDINNILMGIQGNVSLIRMELGLKNPQYQRLSQIEEHVKRGSNLTKQLLGFARGGKYEIKTLSVNDLVRKSAHLFLETRKEIKGEFKLQDDAYPVDADAGQIEQALLNIFINAGHAMPRGGYLSIQTANIALHEADAAAFDIKAGDYVKISISDTGIGMDKETLDKIFEPFFTTRQQEGGTGLGLASVYGIMRNHGGVINVYSEPGKGSVFNIYLPSSLKPLEDEEPAPQNGLLLGSGGILLVDDESVILDTASAMLEMLGYTVHPASNGQEAAAIYRESRDKIDLVILDMVMPGTTGSQVLKMLMDINPHIKVILSSGYGLQGEVQKVMEMGCRGFIQKPYNFIELSSIVHRVLKDEV